MVDKDKTNSDLSKREAEIAFGFLLQLRNTDLTLLWTRSTIFLAIEGIILGFVLDTMSNPSLIPLCISGYGLFIAIIWVIITRNGCSWLEGWENQMQEIEHKVFPNSPDIAIFRDNKYRANIKPSIKETLKRVTYANMIIWYGLFLFFVYSTFNLK